MNCNKSSLEGLEPDYVTPRCNRAKLDTGTFCNYDCEFCYYQGDLDKVTHFDVIKERIDTLYKYGINEVDLSGGESSVHKQWFDILDYCNERFDHISTLSNGWAFAKEEFLIKSKEHGLKEILFSVHGYDEESHDDIVRRRGGWRKILKAIELCHKHGIIVRVNCTVYQRNYKGLKTYHNIIKDIKPLEVNFLTLNYWTNNRHATPIDYIKVTDEIKKCIDRIKDHVKYINVRYTPYCFMKGYEKYVCDQFQHIYDRYDWNVEIYDVVAGDVDPYDYDVDVNQKYTEKEKIDKGFRAAGRVRLRDYKKPPACLLCKYFYICDGLENQMKDCTVVHEPGEKITDVNHFRKGFYE
jgi:MoaA/NifB/PqqE/SkfB family radical SAM enzyme